MATTHSSGTAAVPLALWLLPPTPSPTSDHDRLLAVIRRTITEYATPTSRTVVATASSAVATAMHGDTPPINTVDPGQLRTVTGKEPLDLTVLDNPRPGTVRDARRLVGATGLVVALSAPIRRGGRWRDPLPDLIVAARATGMRYQQHVLAVADPSQQPADPPARRRPPPDVVPLARRAHVDVLVFTTSKECP